MAFLGEESQWAAEASECAADQDKFWEYHDILFEKHSGENQGAFAKDKLKGFAAELKLDAKAFAECLDSGKYTAQVQQETQAAKLAGVQSTPSFFVNDWPVTGALPLTEFDALIAKAQQGLHPAPTPTPLPAGAEFYQVDPNRPGLTYNGSPYQGAATAPVIVLSFEDFKSAAAATHALQVEPAIKTKYIDPGTVRFVTMLFPNQAPRAAAAAVCASDQNKFWEYRTVLYQKQQEWTEGDDAAMSGYARELGLDEAKFSECLASEATANRVSTALSFASNEVGVPESPSYLVLKVGGNGKVETGKGYPGALPLEQFEAAIVGIQTPPTPTPTAPPPVSKEELDKMPVGVDAEGNFYRGDPKAAVKLVDFSDFQ